MTHDIVIVGGGLTGCAMALAVASCGLSACVIDAQPVAPKLEDGFDGRSYAIARGSQRMLQALDLWGDLADNAQPMQQIKVSDGRVGEAQAFLGLHFDSAEIEDGPMGFMVEDRYLRRKLIAHCQHNDRITLQTGHVTAQVSDARGALVTLDTGDVIQARLLIGADGRQGGTATRAGIRRMGWDYPQTAMVCAIAHAQPHHGIAHQLFLPSGPLAILPLAGNRSSIVWSESTETAQDIQALSDADYLTVLKPRFGDFLGEISLAGARHTYPLNLSLAKSLVADRLALVGDAAHGVHPIAGQGLNAGLRDVAALAHVLSHALRRGEDIGACDVLSRYQQWRRFDAVTLATVTDFFTRLFSNDAAPLRLGRDMGMALVNAVPSLRRRFIREAAGLNGDLPDLMRA